jgi:hypothetical protein
MDRIEVVKDVGAFAEDNDVLGECQRIPELDVATASSGVRPTEWIDGYKDVGSRDVRKVDACKLIVELVVLAQPRGRHSGASRLDRVH